LLGSVIAPALGGVGALALAGVIVTSTTAYVYFGVVGILGDKGRDGDGGGGRGYGLEGLENGWYFHGVLELWFAWSGLIGWLIKVVALARQGTRLIMAYM
jgi:hypothetical protein